MRKLLDLREHKHTAKKLAHHHTSYRGLWLILALSGIGLFWVHRSAVAAEYVITAKVPAQMPTTPATIESPVNGNTVNLSNIVVSGSCPVTNQPVIIGIYNANDELIGSSGCSAGGQFSANIHLVSGANTLTPKIRTITNDEGPIGLSISVTFAVSTPSVTGPEVSILRVTYDSPFVTYKKNQVMDWPIDIQGGDSPYSISVDWGDGAKIESTKDVAGLETLKHTYGKNGTYLIRLVVSGADGQTLTTSVAAITLAESNNSIIGGLGGNPAVNGSTQNSSSATSNLNKAIVLSYSGTVVVVVAFWFSAYRQKKLLMLAGKKRIKK